MKLWDKIVILHPHRAGQVALQIMDARSAARVLLEAWPERSGRSYRRAVLACSAAIGGKAPRDAAQWAFIVATMEAGISYDIVDRLDSEIAAVCREILAEEMPFPAMASPAGGDPLRPPFWWSRRQASALPAQ
ncbi:MAG: DUF982 domain-containing protein [Rhizobiaceae bacterium]|nr:DUF982 domain-containing protein [Rhizobiaceae bacterium]